MSTLPRTKSLGGGDSSTLPSRRKQAKVRPSSFCESTWTRIHPIADSGRLKRSPSQANSLSTTVPTSLVTRPLGGRHTPTRNSLRHSRMVVMNRTSKSSNRRHWSGGVGRVVPLVISAQIFVGGVAIVLAVWLLLWSPSLHFSEVPHYAGVPVFLSGLLGSLLLICFSRASKNFFNTMKSIVLTLCGISILTCTSVCVFTSLHLIRLAPMTCFLDRWSESSSMSSVEPLLSTYDQIEPFDNRLDKLVEGSGSFDDEDFDGSRLVSADQNVTRMRCVCEQIHTTFKEIYDDLNCVEVKNILPILWVASCVVTFVGAILSLVIVYILWTVKHSVYRTVKASEVKPFIFRSKYSGVPTKSLNGDNRSLYR